MIKNFSLYALALLGCLVLFNSCEKEYEDIEALDERTIAAYIANNNLTNVKKDSLGYYYQIITPGTGEEVSRTDTIFYTWDFKNSNGTSIVKSSEYLITSKPLGYSDDFGFLMIPAVRLTLDMLKKGGTAKVIVPSRMAFGKNGVSSLGVGPNEIMIVDLALLTIKDRAEADEIVINKFIAAKNLQMTVDTSGVRYNVSAVGTNLSSITENSTIKVNYTGRLLDGTVFDSATETELKLSQMIEGWIKGIPGKIGVGGKIRMVIPSDLAYKEASRSDNAGNIIIPGSSCLDFDVEIISVTN